MNPINAAVAVYGLLTIALGVYGYVAKGSVPSIIAGGIAGLLVLSTLLLVEKEPRVARIGAAVIALLMLIQMGMKAMKEPHWHTVTLSVASLLMLIVLVGGHFAAQGKRA